MELYSTLQHSECLIEYVIVLSSPPDRLINMALISYSPMTNTSLQQLLFDVALVYPHQRTNIPATINYITLPALWQFEVLATLPANVS